MNRKLNYFSYFVLCSWLIFLGQICWWFYYPYDIIEFTNHCCTEDGSYYQGIVLNEGRKVRRGEMLTIKLEFIKNYDLPARYVTRTLANDRYITLVNNAGGTLQKGKHTKTFNIFIPLNIWPGRYRLENTFSYNPNPFRTINEKWVSEWFEVVP